MSFFKANKSTEVVKESGDSNFIYKSGVYDVTIKHAWLEKNDKNKSKSINLRIEHKGTEQTLFNAFRLNNGDGTDNEKGQDRFNKLLIILGIDELSEPTEMPIPVGKKKEKVEKEAIVELESQDVTFKLINVYTKNDGKIYKALSISDIFRTSDKASAPEIVNAETSKENKDKIGNKYKKTISSTIEDYLIDVTKEEAEEYDKKERENSSSESNNSNNNKNKQTEKDDLFD